MKLINLSTLALFINGALAADCIGSKQSGGISDKHQQAYWEARDKMCSNSDCALQQPCTTYASRTAGFISTTLNVELKRKNTASKPGFKDCWDATESMPVMDGLEAPRQMRAFERHNDIPTTLMLAITGLGSESTRDEATRSGVDLFVTKPAKLRALEEILKSQGVRLLSVVALATTVTAADDAEFAFNLFSDVAPVLALFGEQFAKQFMSESLTWIDHLIFAMVPLGIITAIASAIRIQGPQVARAFIGRARENRALAEIELMSSTSGEVCELFNGSSIVRAMGKPKIAQFLIFPREYDELEQQYEAFDQAAMYSGPAPKDKSCGIHSLVTATSRESSLMECKDYHSQSSAFIRKHVKSTVNRFGTPLQHFCSVFKYPFRSTGNGKSHKKSRDVEMESRGSQYSTPARSGGDGLATKLSIEAEHALRGPPNLQLNLSSDHFDQGWLKKRHELFLAAVAATIIQTALIAIAAVTAFYLSPNSSNFLESKVYGFPCYVAGTVLLSLGVGACSFIVERSTTEHSWDVLPGSETKDRAPRLLWLQQNQTVNDQAFDGYAILAGPKRRIVTSRRVDDVKKRQPSRDSDLQPSQNIPASDGSLSYAKTETSYSVSWELLTVGAALSAALGFGAQFMGLRGLAYPASIAQLLAIFLMALIRAAIRRRLGQVPAHCAALAGYELDFLATRIVFYPGIRNFHGFEKDDVISLGDQSPDKLCCWEVTALDPKEPSAFFFESLQRQSPIPKQANHRSTYNKKNGALHFKPASSQQLLRVRERLGDLCNWTSKSSESALSLAQSIEFFLNTFFSPSFSWRGDHRLEEKRFVLAWPIEATKLTSAEPSDERDIIVIPIVRGEQSGIHEVDIGKIDAVLSLWTASIEGPPNWRRNLAGHGMKHSFYRIIGDNLDDEVLKQDVSWWVDSLIAMESDPRITDRSFSSDYDSSSEINRSRDGQRHLSRARIDKVDLVIGFNGRPHKEPALELGVTSKATLPTILAQHLFTHFMWTIVKSLSRNCLNPGYGDKQTDIEMEGPQTFESREFDKTWLRPRLRHRTLTKVVRQAEVYGLGSVTDILLCMIPALSSMNLLPNHVVLKLMPRVGSGQGWVEMATCHRQLLATINTDTVERQDKFSVDIVTAVMDFLSLAYEPYDTITKPTRELNDQFMFIVKYLASPTFAIVMEKLAPIYRLQRRINVFREIFARFRPLGTVERILKTFSDENIGLDHDFAKNNLGFTRDHMFMLAGPLDRYDSRETCDIFGWTPYHYGCVIDSDHFISQHLGASRTTIDRLCKLISRGGRNPIHIASLEGRYNILGSMLSGRHSDVQNSAVCAGGLDGMTPLHLISRGGNLACFELITQLKGTMQLLASKDLWGRQPLHVASKFGHDEIIAELLTLGAVSHQLDDFGKSPVDYFLESRKRPHRQNTSTLNDYNGSTTHERSGDEGDLDTGTLSKEECGLFLRFEMKDPGCRYGNGKTLLHFAAEVADIESIRALLNKGFDVDARDNYMKTALHYAVSAGRTTITEALIDEFRANPSAKDHRDTTALMLAVEYPFTAVVQVVSKITDDRTSMFHHDRGRIMVEILVERNCDPSTRNSQGKTALHMAIERGNKDAALYLLGLEDPGQIQADPFDNNKDSLLIAACQNGMSEAVPKILDQWPDIINAEDSNYGKPPLSWVCQLGHDKIVEQLLLHDGVDVNQPTPRHNMTPLHFAVEATSSKCLALLLQHPSTELDRKDNASRTPIQRAAKQDRLDAAQMLLLDDRTSPEERVDYIKEFSSPSSSVFYPIISGVLLSVKDESLVLEFLLWLIDDMAAPNMLTSIAQFTEDLKHGAWKQFKLPYHISVLLGDYELVKMLKEQGASEEGLDQDRWSWVDYVERFDRNDTLATFSSNIQGLGSKKTIKLAEPTTLVHTAFRDTIQVTSYVKLTNTTTAIKRACMRSDHCIPVFAKHFYFEIEIIEEPASQLLGVGFCGSGSRDDQMPGWFPRSWGYHGDDGKLYIESGSSYSPSPEFGPAGVFGSGDVVGACLNMETGQGFCTRNGTRLNMGTALQLPNERFRYGKMYPCVGFHVNEGGVGLHFVANFDGSDRHPFKYQGSFEFE
ncbi:hypothetical protein NM208_g4824 [Fusarium decemcellulare]|uniref:Uncharacterized protein n=1 Tax=Fusarium decemcellulare TaxID=57161 RepID=A0ACC1SJB3_9HYPO|nr:hypothetical protein NM208_g4824 [Fusarium decemcellulare]